MNKFNPVELTRANRLKVYDSLLDLGTSDTASPFHVALHNIQIAKRFSASATILKGLISTHNENIYFYCIPRTKLGIIEGVRLQKLGALRARTFCTKNIRDALFHNRAMRKPALNVPCKLVMLMDKKPSEYKGSSHIRYNKKTSRPVILGIVSMSIHRKFLDAKEITRRK